jgi:hypothetical protein
MRCVTITMLALQEGKLKKAAKMFNDAVGAFMPATKLGLGASASEWPAVLQDITTGIQAMFHEVNPRYIRTILSAYAYQCSTVVMQDRSCIVCSTCHLCTSNTADSCKLYGY